MTVRREVLRELFLGLADEMQVPLPAADAPQRFVKVELHQVPVSEEFYQARLREQREHETVFRMPVESEPT